VRETRNAYTVLVGNPVGKYPLERREDDFSEIVRTRKSKWIRSLEEDE
jgi:hypothetical protein